MQNKPGKVDKLLGDLKPFLQNLQKGISTLGINAFNEQIDSILSTEKKDRDQIIKTILSVICSEFKITLRALLSSHATGQLKEAKYTCACLLHFEYKLTIRSIGRYVFKMKQFGFVFLAIKRHRDLNEKVKPDKEYKERYNRLLIEIKNKLEQK